MPELFFLAFTILCSHQYSYVVIEQMKARHDELRPEMQWHVMDVRDLKFDDSCFDVAIDKG